MTFGRERMTFEAVWTRQRYDLLTEFLSSVPVTWRFFLKHRIFDEVDKLGGDARPIAEQMAVLFARLRRDHAL